MSPAATSRSPRILVPLVAGSANDSVLELAHLLAQSEQILLVGVVPVPEGETLSRGARPARDLRDLMHAHIDRVNLHHEAHIHVSYTPWDDIHNLIVERTSIDLLILDWPNHLEALDLTAAEILSHPPCDVALVRGPIPKTYRNILVVNRGGPHAERALRLGLTLARSQQANLTSLNIRRPQTGPEDRRYFAAMARILGQMPDIEQRQVETDNQSGAILDASRDFDLTVLGTVAHPTKSTASFGSITDTIFDRAPNAVIAIKTKRVIPGGERDIEFGARAISVLVDRWFAENTFHADEFADLKDLLSRKAEQNLKISLALPALNEEETIGAIIQSCQRSLMEEVPLLDEIVLIDSNSTDGTRKIARDLGLPVYIHQEILTKYGPRIGKGEGLWKSLYVTEGDLVLWVDTDIKNFHPRFVYGQIGPLLHRPNLKFVKGFYRRPLKSTKGLQPGRGGRVTELTARPLLNLFYPGLSGIIQPLAGEYGGRRKALEQLTFASGYGVEICLLIEVYEKFKLASIAQVDQVERIHRNQPLSNLSKMSFAIIQTLFGKLEQRHHLGIIEDVNRAMKSVGYESGLYYLNVEEIVERERPPMNTIPEYRKKFELA